MAARIALLAAVVFLASACGSGESSAPGPSPSSPGAPTAPADGRPAVGSSPTPSGGGAPAAFDTIDTGGQSGIAGGQPQVLKIETEAEWEEFWSRHQAIVTPQPALPVVDFSQKMVIAVVDRQEPSGGFLLEITAIEEAEGGLVIRVNKLVPGPDCVVAAVVTRPFHIIELHKSDLQPRLEISEETRSCG